MSSSFKPVVLIFAPVLDAVSGVSTHVRLLQRSSLADSYELIHFEVGSEGKSESVVHKALRFLFSPLLLFVTILRLHVDIVHINTSFNAKSVWRDFVYLLIAKLLGRKVIYQIHGGYLPLEFCNKSRIIECLIKKMLAMPDVVVLLTTAEFGPYNDFAQIKQLEVIPNAIDLSEFESSEPGLYENGVTELVYIGRLVEEKGVQDTLEALAIMRDGKGINGLQFSIAGSGPYEDTLKQIVNKLKLQNVVTFLGPIFGEEKRRFWEQADLFVFPTFHQEGLPYVLLEAMASATPVVISDMGAISEVIEDGKHGMLVESRNPARLADNLELLLADSDKVRMMSRETLSHVREKYGIEQLSAGFLAVYGSIIEKSSTNSG